jgi:hypothetical protein
MRTQCLGVFEWVRGCVGGEVGDGLYDFTKSVSGGTTPRSTGAPPQFPSAPIGVTSWGERGGGGGVIRDDPRGERSGSM